MKSIKIHRVANASGGEFAYLVQVEFQTKHGDPVACHSFDQMVDYLRRVLKATEPKP